MKKIPHQFKAMLFGDAGAGNFFQVWQSVKYPNLQVWVFGRRGKPGLARQFRVKGWDPVIESLEDGLKIARAGKKRRCLGLPATYFYTGPLDNLSSNVPLRKLRPDQLQSPLGSKVRKVNPKDQSSASDKSLAKLRSGRGAGAGNNQTNPQGRRFHTLWERQERPRVLRRTDRKSVV